MFHGLLRAGSTFKVTCGCRKVSVLCHMVSCVCGFVVGYSPEKTAATWVKPIESLDCCPATTLDVQVPRVVLTLLQGDFFFFLSTKTMFCVNILQFTVN